MTTKRVQHTPGPWTVQRDDSGLYICMEPLGNHDEYLAVYASPNEAQREADAALIAAAPIMYAYIVSRASSGDKEANKLLKAIDAHA